MVNNLLTDFEFHQWFPGSKLNNGNQQLSSLCHIAGMSSSIDRSPASSTAVSSVLDGIDFYELREGRCKFPLGMINDPPERFCGAPADIGAPYCLHCQSKAYSRVDRRRPPHQLQRQ